VRGGEEDGGDTRGGGESCVEGAFGQTLEAGRVPPDDLRELVHLALQQTERVYAMVKQLSDGHVTAAESADRAAGAEGPVGRARDRAPGVMLASNPEQKPLTRREREVLSLISEGCSNKQGALRGSRDVGILIERHAADYPSAQAAGKASHA